MTFKEHVIRRYSLESVYPGRSIDEIWESEIKKNNRNNNIQFLLDERKEYIRTTGIKGTITGGEISGKGGRIDQGRRGEARVD